MLVSRVVLLLSVVLSYQLALTSGQYARIGLSAPRSSFAISVQSDVPSSCGGNLMAPGFVQSVGYPRAYPSRKSCKWVLRGPEGSTLTLYFSDFLLEKNDACNSDYLMIYDGEDSKANRIGKYCGVDVPKVVSSTKNALFLVFKSDERLNKRGFQLFFNSTGGVAAPSPLLPLETTAPTLVFQKPPVFVSSLRNGTVQSYGEILNMICSVTGTPTPEITWTKDGVRVDDSKRRFTIKTSGDGSSKLRVRKTNFKDSGVYGCTADNGVGSPISSYGFVSVEGQPIIKDDDGPQSQNVAVGQSVQLQCKADGRPKPQIRWMIGDSDVTDKARVVGLVSSLTFTPKTASKVRCSAINKHGIVASEAVVNVLGPPVITESPESQNVLNNHTAELRCKAEGTPKARYRWSSEGLDVTYLSRNKGGASILKIRVPENIEVVCYASNVYGKTTAEAKLTVVGPPSIDKRRSFKNQTVTSGTRVTLTCYLQGIPLPHVRWYVNGTEKKNHVDNLQMSNLTLTIVDTVIVHCAAKNVYATAHHTAIITVTGGVGAYTPRESSLNVILVAAIIGSLVGVALIAMVLMCYCKQRRHDSGKFGMAPAGNTMELTSNPMFHKAPLLPNFYICQELQQLEYPRNSIEFIRDIEDGSFSRLFLGRAKNLVKGEECTMVQVKVLKDGSCNENCEQNFEKEAVALSKLNHPNVCRLVGVCVTGKPPCLMFEHQERGDLHQFLRDCGCSNYAMRQRSQSRGDSNMKLTNIEQLHIAKQIAAGMMYLTSKGYIHRELTTKCCFIDRNLVVKIGNIGLNWATPMVNYYRHNAVGRSRFPVRWLPPETILYGLYTEETDVWSFGVVMWEIYSYSLLPYYGMNNDEIISYIREGDVLPCPKDCPEEVYEIMRECWHLLGSERPTFRIIYDRISALNTGIAV